MPSKYPIHYESISIDYRLQNGNTVRAGFSDVKVHILIADGTPFITEEFGENKPTKQLRKLKDGKEHLIANIGGDGVVHNLSAYSFIRVHNLLRGVDGESIDEIVRRLMNEVSLKLDTRDTMLQFYAVMNVPPPEGFDDFYPS